MKLEFFGQILEMYSDIKFRENPSSGSRVVPCGRTDRQTGHGKATRHFSQFCEKRLQLVNSFSSSYSLGAVLSFSNPLKIGPLIHTNFV